MAKHIEKNKETQLLWKVSADDVAPVVHGRWKRVAQICVDGEYVDIYRCGKCSIPHETKSRYCPNCGAKMDLKEGES